MPAPHPADAPLAAPLAATLADLLPRHADTPGGLLPLLHEVQHLLGCIPPEAVPAIAEALNRSRAEVQGVIDHYPDFRQTPPVGRVLKICRAEACQAMGGEALWQAAQALGSDTVEPVYCLGLCACAPSLMLDGVLHARATPERLQALLDGGAA
ncbi:NAD(P)H-dependent oxidoreductase subunit E [Inhella sp.]|uniref:NAD(P)H-dependent oxidoreductase subunit E n=1 Tax=Inhella sp. TaxID=1921806 RepID=UPI0035B18577